MALLSATTENDEPSRDDNVLPDTEKAEHLASDDEWESVVSDLTPDGQIPPETNKSYNVGGEDNESDDDDDDERWDLVNAESIVDVRQPRQSRQPRPPRRIRPVRRVARFYKQYGPVVLTGPGMLHQGDNIRRYINHIRHKRVRIQRTYKKVIHVASQAPKTILSYAWKGVQVVAFLALGGACLILDAQQNSHRHGRHHAAHHNHHRHHHQPRRHEHHFTNRVAPPLPVNLPAPEDLPQPEDPPQPENPPLPVVEAVHEIEQIN